MTNPIPYVENSYFLSRENNIIFANLIDGSKVPLIRLKQKFIDINILEGQAYDYMKNYLQMYPELWEHIKEEKPQEQLTLF